MIISETIVMVEMWGALGDVRLHLEEAMDRNQSDLDRLLGNACDRLLL
ncbi:hypothetical protein JJD41_21610 [Oxynema sp. CENA135]|nr:hypothetical protein [Oxynema sp. CENA135]MBK4732440.1 hypothetical protein [Oxynema sp. CENA135]